MIFAPTKWYNPPSTYWKRTMTSPWIDISVMLQDGMVHWPGDPAVSIERMLDMDHGDTVSVTKFSMGAHTGTHIDAPIHYLQQTPTIDQIPLDIAIGPVRVIEIKDAVAIHLKELEQHLIQKGERILFKTKNSSQAWNRNSFQEDFVFISEEAAGYLASKKPKLIGIDYLSVGGFKVDGAEIHRILLREDIWILEGIQLGEVQPGDYDLICLPLKIQGADGAPARAILRPRP